MSTSKMRYHLTTFMPDRIDYNNSLNLSIYDIEIYLEELSDNMATALFPAILVQVIILFIGAVGNSLVLFIYLFKFNPSSTRTAILALAFLDLLTCALCIPGEIMDLRYSFNFTSQFLCKGLRFFTTAFLMASGFTLLNVALDRYQRICHPLHQQLSASKARIRVVVSCLAATLFAIPASVVYGLAQVPTDVGVYGKECSTSQTFANHPFRIAYNIILFIVFLAAFATMIVIYIFIGQQILKQKHFRNSVQHRKGSTDLIGIRRRHTSRSNDVEGDHSISDGAKESSFSQEPIPDNDPLSNISDGGGPHKTQVNGGISISTRLSRKSSVLHRLRKMSQSGATRTRKTTLMLFFITMVFVISFLPHLLLKGMQAVNKNFVDNLSMTGVIFYNIFVRSYFFNTAANAFVYGFCSPKFRHECRALLLKMAFWAKRRKLSLQSNDPN